MSRVRTGLERFLRAGPGNRRERIGLIAHQASVTPDLVPAWHALKRRGFNLSALFAPEHGLGGTLQDQAHVAAARFNGLPVQSLYGESRTPSAASLRNVDTLVFDLQDIGVRYYTFIWTMALSLEAAAQHNKRFVILDRPNPLNGVDMEGNVLDPAFASFVGLHPIPVRHAMTVGELAIWLARRLKLQVDLHVTPMTGWKRRMWFDETGLPWVLPSPNMPTLDAASVYAGMCLLEATNISEGRGTTRPFEIVGAPWMNADKLVSALARRKIPGVIFRPAAFQPTFNKYSGEPCEGVQWHVTDRAKFRSFEAGLLFLETVRSLWPRSFRWKPPPYEFETVKPPIDILCGTGEVRNRMDRGKSIAPLFTGWQRERDRFFAEARTLFLYKA